MRSYATQWSQCSELAVPSLTATFPVSGHPYLKSAGGERRGAVRGRAVGSVRYIFKPGCGCFKKIHLQWPPSRSPNKDCQSIKNISDSPFPPPRHGVVVGGPGWWEGVVFFTRVIIRGPGSRGKQRVRVNNIYYVLSVCLSGVSTVTIMSGAGIKPGPLWLVKT